MTSAEIENQVKTALAYMHTVRDEIRVRIHLGEMELKQLWSELEPQLAQLDLKVHHATTEVLAALQALTDKLVALRSKLESKDSAKPPTS